MNKELTEQEDDVEQLAKNYKYPTITISHSKIQQEGFIEGYKAGLEYAENHYLKMIEDKDKELESFKHGHQLLDLATNNQTLKIALIQAKELLKKAKDNIGKTKPGWGFLEAEIEEFLK
jgi:flagellar biosynthesis/type III secretory pathway protein FliH